MTPTLFQLPAFQDNYLFVLRDEVESYTIAVDPGDAAVIESFLQSKGWGLDAIWITHHHSDHIGGMARLKKTYGSQVFGPFYDRHRIFDMDVPLSDGDEFIFYHNKVQVLFLPGHTLGHIAFYLPQPRWLFCGDVLFSVGCGRLFEGTPEQLMGSLQKILALPGETQIFCAHEYTQKNVQFALSLDPENTDLNEYANQVSKVRQAHQPTVPFELGLQRKINPFLRPDCSRLRRNLGMESSTDIEVLARLRELRNQW